jgi:glycosyltransferase involved in cell wall biosynthesis
MDKNSNHEMKILMIAPQPFFEARGTPLSIYDRLRALSDLGYQVDLVTYHIGENIRIPGVRLYRNITIPFINSIKIGPSFTKLFLDILIFLRAIPLLLSNKYIALHSHEEASFFSVILSWFSRVPHIYDMHSRLPLQLRSSKYKNWKLLIWMFEYMEKKVLQTCSAVITIGDDLEEYVRKTNPDLKNIKIENLPLYASFAPSNPGEIKILKNGLALDNKLPIVYTGTFEPYQGLNLLIESAKIVFEKNQQAVLILVGGTDSQVMELRNKTQRLHMSDRVIFTSTVDPSEAMKYLEIASILVSPRLDGTSIPSKIYTYMYSGKPILATDIPAHRLITDQTIHLAEPTVDCFAKGILNLLDDHSTNNNRITDTHRSKKIRALLVEYLSNLKSLYQRFQKEPLISDSPATTLENR